MQRSRFGHIASVCLALVVGCATGAVLDKLIVPPARAGQGQHFDYVVIDVQATWGLTGGTAEDQQHALNRYGAEGWRVVATLGNKVYLEREAVPGSETAELPPG